MALTSDIYAITPTFSATLFRAAAAIAGAGAITLITNQPLDNGAGYQPIFTCAGDATAATFTIVGFVVGDLTGNTTTETVAGLNTAIATSVNYYSQITSISSDAAVATNVSIGTLITDGVALPRGRLRGFYYVATAGAGAITLTANGTAATDRILLSIATPAVVESQQMSLPGDGILMGGSSATSSYAVLINTTAVTSITAFVG
tara:strand:- start:11 stop:622 length:612 start_codon:yes stop_codon:yes gene_type:complete